MACNSGGFFVSTEDATIDPIATVMAKSKPDIFEKLRRPARRVKRMTLK
jgi:hypothetical protein